MFDTRINQKNAIMMISVREHMTGLYKREKHKQSQRRARLKRAWRIIRNEGAMGVVRWAKRKLRSASPVEEVHLRGNIIPARDLQLDSPNTAARKELYFSKERIAIYTVLFGAYDAIRSPLMRPDNIDYYIITDQNVPAGRWIPLAADALLPGEILGDPVLCNRWCKMHPQLLFPEYSVSIYVDASFLITSDLPPCTAALDSFPVSMFRHYARACVYDEVRVCTNFKFDSQTGEEQERLLREHGVPEHWGLLEAPVIARRHHDALCVSIMERWWQTFYEEPAKRDQIALIDCLWKMNISPEKIGVLGANVYNCPMLIKFPHRHQGG